MKQPAIYILANRKNGTLYTGVTSNLAQRIYQHKNETYEGFSSKHGCKKLVYYEVFKDMENAILREKQIKGGSRKKKIELIESLNPDWFDLYKTIIGEMDCFPFRMARGRNDSARYPLRKYCIP